MSCNDERKVDLCLHADERFFDAIFLQDEDLVARDLTGNEVTMYIWNDAGMLFTLTDGDGLTVGGAEAVQDDRGRAAGTATRVDFAVSEPDIQAADRSTDWGYEFVLTASGVAPEILMYGVITHNPIARPR